LAVDVDRAVARVERLYGVAPTLAWSVHIARPEAVLAWAHHELGRQGLALADGWYAIDAPGAAAVMFDALRYEPEAGAEPVYPPSAAAERRAARLARSAAPQGTGPIPEGYKRFPGS
jgi:hypothetical protein